MKHLNLLIALSLMVFVSPMSFALEFDEDIQTYFMDHPDRVEDKYIVKLKPSKNLGLVPNSPRKNLKEIKAVKGLYVANESQIQRLLDKEDSKEIIYIEAAVRFAGLYKRQKNTQKKTTSTPTQDPGYANQWGMWDKKAGVFADRAWTAARGSSTTIVAIIDSGFSLDHPDLIPNIWRNKGEFGTDSAGNSKSTNGLALVQSQVMK